MNLHNTTSNEMSKFACANIGTINFNLRFVKFILLTNSIT